MGLLSGLAIERLAEVWAESLSPRTKPRPSSVIVICFIYLQIQYLTASHLVIEEVIQLQKALLILRVMFIYILQELDLIQTLVHVILVVLQQDSALE